MGREIAITGLGWVTSIGCGGPAVLESLVESRSGIRPVKWFPGESECPVRVSGTIPEFDVSSHAWPQWQFPSEYKIRRDVLRGLAPHGVYAICAVLQALQDAGLGEEEISREDTGLFCASAGSPFLAHRYLAQMEESKGKRGHPMGIVSSISGTLNFNLGAYFKIKGANLGFVSACASSSHAIAYAMEEIRSGRQRRMVVLGAEDINAASIVPFSAMRVLSLSEGSAASCPFDLRRDGFVGTGGAVALILEDAETAKDREASIYAKAVGWGQASDGYNIAISHEQGDGLARAIENALKDAELNADDIGYINAHATSTVIGDISEARAIRRVFGSEPEVPVSSTKALTGHSLSMAGALEAAICCLALKEGLVFPQAHLRDVDPECGFLNLPNKVSKLQKPFVMSNSSGFGGSNVALILGRP